jgi:hypothetical protein
MHFSAGGLGIIAIQEELFCAPSQGSDVRQLKSDLLTPGMLKGELTKKLKLNKQS